MTDYKRESEHFLSFRRHYRAFPEGEVLHDDKPDFLILSDSTIGVEHSEVFLDRPIEHPRQAQESQNRHIVEIARDHAELRGMPPVDVDLFFRDHASMARPQRIELGRRIARVCWENLPPMGESATLEHTFRNPFKLPDEMRYVSIARHPSMTRHCWHESSASMVLEETTELFQTEIQRKQSQVASYRRRCEECWLLLVAHGGDPSSFIEPNETSLVHRYRSSFDRLFFLRYFEGRLHELQLAPDSPAD